MAGYTSFLLRKLTAIFLTFLAAITFVFVMVRLVGDPFSTLVLDDPRITQEQIEQIKAVYGLNKPLYEQYVDFIVNALRGEFGYSLYYQRPAFDVIMERLPWTLLLLLPAIIISTIFSIYLGMKTAWRHGTRYDVTVTSLALFVRSMPHFWLAIIFLMVFGYYLGLFPLSGCVSAGVEYPSILDYILDILWHAALPITVLVIRQIGMYMLYMRNSMVEVMGQDFVWMAKLKGLAEEKVMYRHAARVAILPMVTVTGRSVWGRRVRQGTPRAVVSSWMPPESVKTSRAWAIRQRNSRYPRGSVATSRLSRPSMPKRRSRSRVRGCTGNTTGSSPEIRSMAPRIRPRTAGSSTLRGRCRVRSAYPPGSRPSFLQASVRSARWRWRRRVSIMVLPTRKMASAGRPSRRRLSTASCSVANRRSDRASVSTRFTSSGMVRSKLRRPASTWASRGRLPEG